MGVNSGSLQRDISANAHHFTADLIGDFERVEVQIFGRADQQRIQKFDQGRNNELIAPGFEKIQELAPQRF